MLVSMETNRTSWLVPVPRTVCDNRAPRNIVSADTGESTPVSALADATLQRTPPTDRARARRKVARKQARASRKANR
jgi:hypothetical protein